MFIHAHTYAVFSPLFVEMCSCFSHVKREQQERATRPGRGQVPTIRSQRPGRKGTQQVQRCLCSSQWCWLAESRELAVGHRPVPHCGGSLLLATRRPHLLPTHISIRPGQQVRTWGPHPPFLGKFRNTKKVCVKHKDSQVPSCKCPQTLSSQGLWGTCHKDHAQDRKTIKLSYGFKMLLLQ